jgi:hypothetical protein
MPGLYALRASFGLDRVDIEVSREEKLASGKADMELCEIKNGRLAMIAITVRDTTTCATLTNDVGDVCSHRPCLSLHATTADVCVCLQGYAGQEFLLGSPVIQQTPFFPGGCRRGWGARDFPFGFPPINYYCHYSERRRSTPHWAHQAATA